VTSILSNDSPGEISYDGTANAGSGNNIGVNIVISGNELVVGTVKVIVRTLITCGSEMPRSSEDRVCSVGTVIDCEASARLTPTWTEKPTFSDIAIQTRARIEKTEVR
jgi:hypothetical protein